MWRLARGPYAGSHRTLANSFGIQSVSRTNKSEVINGAEQLKVCNKGKLFHTFSQMGLLSTQLDRGITGHVGNAFLLHQNSILRNGLRVYG